MAEPTINKFKGLDNKNRPESLIATTHRQSYLTEAENVDISSTFSASRRQGFTLADSGDYHSLWSNEAGTLTLAVKDGILVRIMPDLSLVDLIHVGQRRISYADTGAGIYMSNGSTMLMFDGTAVTTLASAGTYVWPTRNAINPDEEAVFYDAPPPCVLLKWMFGRLWAVCEEVVYYSRAFRPDMFDLRNDYLDIPGVTMLAAVDDGFYISSDRTYYHQGGNPKEPGRLSVASVYSAISGTAIEVSAGKFGFDNLVGRVAVWESEIGKVMGSNGGQIVEMTSKRVSAGNFSDGAMFLREKNGQSHLVSSMASIGFDDSNMRTSDVAIAEVRRNGTII